MRPKLRTKCWPRGQLVPDQLLLLQSFVVADISPSVYSRYLLFFVSVACIML